MALPMIRLLALSGICLTLSNVAATAASSKHRPVTSDNGICELLSGTFIDAFWPSESLQNLSGIIEPIFDDSFKAHIGFQDPPESIEPLSFDIDNSGVSKRVLIVSYGSHANSSDTYYAYDSEAWKALTAESFTGVRDGLHATIVFPWIWEKCNISEPHQSTALLPGRSVRECSNQEPQLPFFTVSRHGRHLHWRAAYLHLVPFKYQSSTYFLATTEDVNLLSAAFVIKPMPQGQYEITCNLQTSMLSGIR